MEGDGLNVHAAMADDRVLRRIVALLVALAVLAEQVAHRSTPVRLIVLWLLRRAETVAAEFVFEETGIPAPAVEGGGWVGNEVEDALRIAERLRLLAAWLSALLPDAVLPKGRSGRHRFASGRLRPAFVRAAGGWSLVPNDTS